jgi:hypothetical protein
MNIKVDPELYELINDASAFVEQAFKHQGVIHPMWIAADRSGNQAVVPTPVPFVDQAAKDHAVRVVRAMFEFTSVTRYVFVCESWILLADDAPIDIDAVQRAGISDHPARREVINMTAESETAGLVMAWRHIIRPTKGKARLGPLIVEQRDGLTVEGRMSSMLPRRGRPS